MRCHDAQSVMGQVLASASADPGSAQLAEHLRSCACCHKQWERLQALALAVTAAAPERLLLERSLLAPAREALVLHSPRRRAGRRLWPALAAAALLLLVALGPPALRLGRQPRSLVSMVDAAMAQPPTHAVTTLRHNGAVVYRQDLWRLESGETFADLVTSGSEMLREAGVGAPLHYYEWALPRQNLFWMSDPVRHLYFVNWTPGGVLNHGSLPLREPASPGEIIGAARRWLQGPGVTERQALLDGHAVRVVSVTGRLVDGRPPSTLAVYVDAENGRLLREVVSHPSLGGGVLTEDTYPLEYGPLPAGAFRPWRLPPGAEVHFEGRQVVPVWETLPEAEKQQVQETVAGLADAWHRGDFAAFSRYYDFAAGLQYGAKGRWSASELQTLWRRLVEQQPTRWREGSMLIDYAVQTDQPPALALDFWSIEARRGRERPAQVYGKTPGREPGLLVLARECVTDHEGRKRELRTRLFLRKVAGQYKVILWRPPFA